MINESAMNDPILSAAFGATPGAMEEAESAPMQQLLLDLISARGDSIRSRAEEKAEEEALLRELPARLKRSGSMSKSWQLLALPARVLPEAVLPAFLKPADADADEVEETPPSALDALIEDSIPTPAFSFPLPVVKRVVTDDVTRRVESCLHLRSFEPRSAATRPAAAYVRLLRCRRSSRWLPRC